MSSVYRIAIKAHVSDGTLLMPSLHYKEDVPAGGSPNGESTIASNVWAHIGSAFLACLPTRDTVDSVEALEEVVAPAIGGAGSHAVNSNGTLSGSGDSMPEGCVPVINLHTNTRSRSARGWLHMPSPHWSDYVSNNVWSGSGNTALQALCALLDDSIDEGGAFPCTLVPVVYSRTRAQRAEDPFAFNVTSATLNPRVHWLKSRMSTP